MPYILVTTNFFNFRISFCTWFYWCPPTPAVNAFHCRLYVNIRYMLLFVQLLSSNQLVYSTNISHHTTLFSPLPLQIIWCTLLLAGIFHSHLLLFLYICHWGDGKLWNKLFILRNEQFSQQQNITQSDSQKYQTDV